MITPDWLAEWPSVLLEVIKISHRTPDGPHFAVLERLATDERMKEVWQELTRRNRADGTFLHVARAHSDDAHMPSDLLQARSLAETLHLAFHAGCESPHGAKMDEVRAAQVTLQDEAQVLRRVANRLFDAARKVAQIGDQTAIRAADNGVILREVADWLESMIPAMRAENDPLTITNDRGSREARGVGAVVCSFLAERFGSPLYRTAATLASVALGVDVSERMVRSAFSRPK
jgi:hypothetical protein